MNKELFDELKELAKEYNVSPNALKSITRRALEIKEFSDVMLSDGQLYEIIKESIQNYDHTYAPMGEKGNQRKSIEQTVELVAEKVLDNTKAISINYDYSDEDELDSYLKHH
jgi:hypothetical protein